MRYRASEKLEIIRLVEQSHLGENGGDKLVHGSGGISQPRAE